MVVFFSDMHFGRGDDRHEERAHEAALIRCLEHLEAEASHLVLLGDVFDQYIEYRHLVPKGCVRFLGYLARWVDSGRSVTYVLGNHDPWHKDYLEREIGVHMVDRDWRGTLAGTPVYLAHGDQFGSRLPFYGGLKAALRHPVPVWVYRTLLPADAGMRLARWVLRRMHTDVIDEQVVDTLRAHARAVLQNSDARVAVMGHSHRAEATDWPEGRYINTGCWRTERTFAILDESGIRLQHWNGSCPQNVESSL